MTVIPVFMQKSKESFVSGASCLLRTHVGDDCLCNNLDSENN